VLYILVDGRRADSRLRHTTLTNFQICTLLPPDDGATSKTETCRDVVTQQTQDKYQARRQLKT
jgi:hypothetical protein